VSRLGLGSSRGRDKGAPAVAEVMASEALDPTPTISSTPSPRARNSASAAERAFGVRASAPAGALARTPKARSAAEAEFLALGDGVELMVGVGSRASEAITSATAGAPLSRPRDDPRPRRDTGT